MAKVGIWISLYMVVVACVGGCCCQENISLSKNDIDEYIKREIDKNTDYVDCGYPPETALSFAAKNGDIAMVKKLIGYGIDVNSQVPDFREYGPFDFEFSYASDDVSTHDFVPDYADQCLNYTYPCSDYNYALNIACDYNDYEMAKFLLESGAEIEVNDSWGGFPLIFAVQAGNARLVELLLKHGADPNYTNQFPLRVHTKVKDNDFDDLKIRVQLPQIGIDHYYAIKGAIESGKPEIVKMLLDAGANPSISWSQKGDMTPLKLAIEKGNYEIIKIIKQYLEDSEM